MRVTAPKGSRTCVDVVESHPVVQKIDISTRLRHRIFFAESKTPESAAKPAGAKFCKIREQIGGTRAGRPGDDGAVGDGSPAPHRNDFQPADIGKAVYYGMRWINTTGEAGPWSLIYNGIVPG